MDKSITNDSTTDSRSQSPPAASFNVEETLKDESAKGSEQTTEDKNRDPRWYKRLAADVKIMLFINALLFVAACLAVGVAWYQAQLTRQALDDARESGKEASENNRKLIAANEKLAEVAAGNLELARETAKIGNRPYVTIKSINLREAINPESRADIAITFQNLGATPAFNATLPTYIEMREKAAPNRLISRSKPQTRDPIVIPSTLSHEIIVSTDTVLPNEIVERIRRNDVIIYVKGTTIYADGFGQKFNADFCRTYSHEKDTFDVCNTSGK